MESPHSRFISLFLIPSSLVFMIGLLEDLTKRVSVSIRLIVTMFAALIGCVLLDATVRTFGIPVVDTLFQINLIALVFTIIAVAGVANAVNLIDGFNGLSGFVCVTALLALGVVAYMAGDQMVFTIALASTGAVAGFLVWNYPNAKIFLGDGGAYLVGFVIAELSVLLHERNPQVSVLFPLLLVIYPIFETLFSIYRRKFVRGQSAGAPDAMHLHQLINKRIVRWRANPKHGPARSRGNAMTSPYLWALNSLAAVPAILFWNRSIVLLGFIFVFTATYILLYRRIVKFQVPRWMFLPYARHVRAQSDKGTIAISANTAWYVYNFRRGFIQILQDQGYRVLVLAPHDEYASRLSDLGCEYIEIKMQTSGVNPLRDVGVIWRYWKLLRQHRPAMFLTFTPKPNIYGAIAASWVKVAVIANVSGLGRAFIEKSWITSVVKILYRLAFMHPAKVFFQNTDDKSIFLAMGLVIEAQAGLLPGSGVDTEKFLPVQNTDDKKPFVFILVARMLRDKGVGEYVEAARLIKSIHPPVRFQLVGFLDADNPSAISRSEMAEWVKEGIVEYLGSTDDVREYFAKADCAVLPSYREGTPRTLLEAASMALPVVTTDAPGCRDTIDHGVTGYLCSVRDVPSLVDCMLKVLQLPEHERTQMGLAGRRKMQRQFSEKFVFDAYLQAIKVDPTVKTNVCRV
jgi:UDP-N-acetylmuramyl pentapeptide phosphotransferase/UDP-N-acetylglucosamine-1-phosphate transferase